MPPAAFLAGSYDYRLVALSVVIAICASYAALDLAGRVTAARGNSRMAWLVGGATAMGVGIWSMHYIGMLAFSLPIPVFYDWPMVLLSAARGDRGVWHRSVRGKPSDHENAACRNRQHFHGRGNRRNALHRNGCDAAHSDVPIQTSLVVLSVGLAVVISFVALLLVFREQRGQQRQSDPENRELPGHGRCDSGHALHGHGCGDFHAHGAAPDLSHSVSISPLGTVGIALVT